MQFDLAIINGYSIIAYYRHAFKFNIVLDLYILWSCYNSHTCSYSYHPSKRDKYSCQVQVRLIGYSVESSLIIVYEFIENGNLCQHLRGFSGSNEKSSLGIKYTFSNTILHITKILAFSGKEPLSWSRRLQIALDSARGLEYIHEHTNPAYIHRDIKSPNILLDKNLRAKVKYTRVIDREKKLFVARKPN